MQKIISIWQPQGFSSHIIAKKVAEKLGVKTSHTGTLDPMAEGVVIVLAGEERHKKYEYAHWEKIYEFGMLFGISTDSCDGLGIPKIEKFIPEDESIKQVVTNMIGKYDQKYPAFSAKKVLGKPLHFFARNKSLSEIEIPIKKGEIYDLEFLGTREIDLGGVVREIIAKVSRTSGDLRQEEIKEAWKNLLNENDAKEKMHIADFRVKMSKGLYVRGLVRDMAEKLKASAFTYYIKRTKNGEYTKETSITLEELFGIAFDENDFASRT